MMLGLNAGRGAKACQGLAACTAPPTLGGADTTILGGTELATSPPTGFESLNPTPEGRQFQPPPGSSQTVDVSKQARPQSMKSFGKANFIVFETSFRSHVCLRAV